MGRRTLLVVVSVLLAAIGTGLIWIYVQGADDRAETQAQRRYGPLPAETATPTASPTGGPHGLTENYGITIEVQEKDRAVGMLTPGDKVAIFAVTKAGFVREEPIATGVLVVAVGTSTKVVDATKEAVANTVLGLDVADGVAQKIWRAQMNGGQVRVAVIGTAIRTSAPKSTLR